MQAKRKIQIYRPKRLLDPKYAAFLPQDSHHKWVAVPDKMAGRKIYVKFEDDTMIIRNWKAEAKMFKRFRDKFYISGSNRRQYYTLGYFRWIPENNETD